MTTCYGCGRPLVTTDPAQRLCPDCRAEGYERLAAALDPSYDPGAWHEWDEVSAVLARLWGRGWEDERYGRDA